MNFSTGSNDTEIFSNLPLFENVPEDLISISILFIGSIVIKNSIGVSDFRLISLVEVVTEKSSGLFASKNPILFSVHSVNHIFPCLSIS